ncbi:hypothetical protein [Variovorax soli]|nr:hypothetical protein [Variovorax soli]
MLASLGCREEIAEAILGHMPEGIVGTHNSYSYDKERHDWLGRLSKHLQTLAHHTSAQFWSLLSYFQKFFAHF